MRNFTTGDMMGDLMLKEGNTVMASLQITLGNQTPVQKYNAEICLNMGGCQDQASSLGATSALLALVLIQYIYA